MKKDVILCKDCKYFLDRVTMTVFGKNVAANGICFAWGDGSVTRENGYCHQAKEREKAKECK